MVELFWKKILVSASESPSTLGGAMYAPSVNGSTERLLWTTIPVQINVTATMAEITAMVIRFIDIIIVCLFCLFDSFL